MPYSSSKHLAEVRNSKESFDVFGISSLLNQIDETLKEDFSKKMLKAAEPIIKKALDEEMKPHPVTGGTLKKSLKSTGAVKNAHGDYYLAYRATTGNETPVDKKRNITNQDKMLFLTNRQFIPNQTTRHNHVIDMMSKREHKGYAIPAYPVIDDAMKNSKSKIEKVMQDVFNEALGGIWQ